MKSNVNISYLSVESAFSEAYNRQQKDLDAHLEGVLFQLYDDVFTAREGLLGSTFFNRGRAFETIKKLGQPEAVRSDLRRKLNQRPSLFMREMIEHPKFQWCYRNVIPNDVSGHIYYSHFDRVASEHALFLAHAVYLTSGIFQIQLKHSIRQGKHYTQGDSCPLTVLFLYYSKHLRKCQSEKEIVKKIKISLCTEFSRQADQDLPEDHENAFRVFPESMRNYIEKRLKDNRKDRLQFFFSVLQSKDLCKEVSDDMVQESLEKHRKTLGERETRKLEPEFKKILVQQGDALGAYLRDHYDPYKTVKATTSASFNNPRSSGGVLGELAEKSYISTSSGCKEYDGENRMEPLVVGLFGQPATGKTTLVQEIISRAHRELFPEWNLSEISYSRSCSSKHWDGYTGQPIVVLDDMGQSDDRLDVEEFQQLISCNTYQLPMAELDNKGTKFSSPLIIVTSNLGFGQNLRIDTKVPIEDNLSFWRRFHIPLILSQKNGDSIIYTDRVTSYFSAEEKREFQVKDPGGSNHSFENLILPTYLDVPKGTGQINGSHYSCARNSTLPKCGVVNFSYKDFSRRNIFPLIWNSFHSSVDFFHRNTNKFWTQRVGSECLQSFTSGAGLTVIREVPRSGTSQNVRYSFPRSPPTGLLPVRVEVVKEPLKVRTITAGEAETRCLKPLQRAMHSYLGTKKQFRLTHGTKFLEQVYGNISECRKDPKLLQAALSKLNMDGLDLVYCSGDYESATDNFILECGSVILKQALKFVDHEPTREWAMKEVSSHIVHYPRSSHLRPIVQTNGQLMGSLLSFPLLCLVNDATAILAGASSDQYLINGDDIVLRVERKVADQWKEIAPRLGLSLSLGKTFFDRDFGTVNSQLFYKGEMLSTGKLKLASRRASILGECYRDLQRIFMNEENSEYLRSIFLKINRPALKKTFESLDVPTSHGGLGIVTTGHTPNKSERENNLFVYLSKLRKKLCPIKGHLKLPFFGFDDGLRDPMFSTLLEVPSEKDLYDGVSGKEMYQTQKCVFKHPKLRSLHEEIKREDMELSELPDLDFIRVRSYIYSGKDYKEKQEEVLNRFLNFFDPNIISDSQNKELVQLFRTMKENREIEAYGLLKAKHEIPFHEYFSSTILPEPLVCERLWSRLFEGLVECEFDIKHDLPKIEGVKTSRTSSDNVECCFPSTDFTLSSCGWDKPSYYHSELPLDFNEELETLPELPIECATLDLSL